MEIFNFVPTIHMEGENLGKFTWGLLQLLSHIGWTTDQVRTALKTMVLLLENYR